MQTIVIPKMLNKSKMYDGNLYSPIGVLYKTANFKFTHTDYENLSHKNIGSYWSSKLAYEYKITQSDLDELDKISKFADRYSRRLKAFTNFLEKFKIPYIIKEDYKDNLNSLEKVKIPKYLGTSYLYSTVRDCFCAAGALLYNAGIPKEYMSGEGSLCKTFMYKNQKLSGFDILDIVYDLTMNESEIMVAKNDNSIEENRFKLVKDLLNDKHINYVEVEKL